MSDIPSRADLAALATPDGERPSPDVIARRLWSIKCIPWALLSPTNPARHGLQYLAEAGSDVWAEETPGGWRIHVEYVIFTLEQWIRAFPLGRDMFEAAAERLNPHVYEPAPVEHPARFTDPVVHRPVLRGDYAASVPPTAREHLYAMGERVPVEVLSDNAFIALLLISTAVGPGPDYRPRVTVDAYEHHAGEWVIECQGLAWQESRYSPAGWQEMYERHLSLATTNGFMPLADIWLAACRKVAEARPNGQMLPHGHQWAESEAR